MIKKKFFMDYGIATVSSKEEIVEFDDDTTDKEIEEVFTEWAFGYLDTAIIDMD